MTSSTNNSNGPATMRAILQTGAGGPEVLSLHEVPRPAPLPTEVLVRVHAAGINPVDTKTRTGGGVSGIIGDGPFIPGWDVSGVVEALGAGVTTLAVGDEVYGMPWFPRAAGAYAEYVTAPSRQFARKPAGISHEQAAAAPLAALTAWQALVDTADVQPGQRVLIHAAAGGVGHLAVQFAKHLGAYVIGTASAGRHEWLRSLGADELVDYTTVRFETAIDPVDVVVDLVGDSHDSTTTRSLELLKPGGHLVSMTGIPAEVAEAALSRGVSTSNILVEPDGASLTKIAALLATGEVKTEVQEVFALADAGRAHTTSETGRTRGKIVLKVVTD